MLILTSREEYKNVERLFHVVCWGFPLLQAFVPIFHFGGINYSLSGAWCWVGVDPLYARFILSYNTVFITILAIIFIYFRIWRHIGNPFKMTPLVRPERVEQRARNEMLRKASKQLMLYPCVFIVCWLPNITNRMVEAAGITVYALVVLESFFLPIQGFVDSMVYGFTSGLYRDWTDWWHNRNYSELHTNESARKFGIAAKLKLRLGEKTHLLGKNSG